jgi:hypothetical protein
MKTLYPIEVTVSIHITDGKGQNGSAKYKHDVHSLPTESDMPSILRKAETALPGGFRLMTRHESTNFVISERLHTNEVFALPKLPVGQKWHDPATQDVVSYSAPEDDSD